MRASHEARASAHAYIAQHHREMAATGKNVKFHNRAAKYHAKKAQWHSKQHLDKYSEELNRDTPNQQTANMIGSVPGMSAGEI